MQSQATLPALFATKLAELAHKQAQVTTAYDYEKNFDEWWTALGKEVFQATLNQGVKPGQPKKNASPNSVR
jgi:hypothetical protein